MIDHSGREWCARTRTISMPWIGVRGSDAGVEHFVALEGAKPGWLDYERVAGVASPDFGSPTIRENDLLSLNYTSGTTARPKGVMITHRNAYLNVDRHTRAHPHDVRRPLSLDVPMFHANGWTFVWIVTAVGRHARLPAQGRARAVFETIARESVTMLCAAPTVLIGIANAPEASRAARRAACEW